VARVGGWGWKVEGGGLGEGEVGDGGSGHVGGAVAVEVEGAVDVGEGVGDEPGGVGVVEAVGCGSPGREGDAGENGHRSPLFACMGLFGGYGEAEVLCGLTEGCGMRGDA
jgi:hypothetical protein